MAKIDSTSKLSEKALQELPYIPFPSAIEYVKAAEDFQNPTASVKAVTSKTGEKLIVLEIVGNVVENDEVKAMKASLWCNKLATEDEFERLKGGVAVKDAELHWGCYRGEDGEPHWAENPALYSFVEQDGNVYVPMGPRRPYRG